MSETVRIAKVNETYIRVTSDSGIERELYEQFTFLVPDAQFIPAVRERRWDGRIHLYSPRTKMLYLGLHSYVKAYCDENAYECLYEDPLDVEIPFSVEEFKRMVAALKLSVTNGDQREAIEPHDYQQKAVIHAIQARRSLLLSPTSSGKSLLIYLLLRYYLAFTKDKILIVVPTTSLVKQLFDDFKDYATLINWDAAEHCHLLYDGNEKHTDKRITISTWQALAVKEHLPVQVRATMSAGQLKQWRKDAPYILDQSYFDQFSVLFGDETHLYASEECSNIIAKCRNAKYRLGTTGTLKESKTNQMVLEGLFGQVFRTITTRELMDQKKVAELTIKCLQLHYSAEEKQKMRKSPYPEEMEFLQSHVGRSVFIRNLALSLDGNTLVMFEKIDKHGKILHDLIAEKVAEGRKVFYVHGKTKTDDRNLIRTITEDETNAIIVCSYGTFSTGVSIRNINNIIFASPTKSKVRVLQSIGRGLRLSRRKSRVILFDIADDLSVSNARGIDVWTNYSLKHYRERASFYTAEQFTHRKYSILLDPALAA